MAPLHNSFKKTEKTLSNNLQNEKKNKKPQLQLGDLIQAAEIKKDY